MSFSFGFLLFLIFLFRRHIWSGGQEMMEMKIDGGGEIDANAVCFAGQV